MNNEQQLTYGTQVDLYTDACAQITKFTRFAQEYPTSPFHPKRAEEWVSIAESLRPIKNWEGPNN